MGYHHVLLLSKSRWLDWYSRYSIRARGNKAYLNFSAPATGECDGVYKPHTTGQRSQRAAVGGAGAASVALSVIAGVD